MRPKVLSWDGRLGAAEARLMVVTDDVGTGEKVLRSATDELRALGRALAESRAQKASVGRDARDVEAARGQLRSALAAIADACRVSGAPPDPRIFSHLSQQNLVVGPAQGPTEIPLPSGGPLDPTELANALAVAWAAEHLAGQEGFVVSLGRDAVASGTGAEGEPLAATLVGRDLARELAGGGRYAALSATRHRARTVATKAAHPLVDPATGFPPSIEFSSAAVAAPTALEAALIARLLAAGGKNAVGPIGRRYVVIATDIRGIARALDDRGRAAGRRGNSA